jgi:hypothetical protein
MLKINTGKRLSTLTRRASAIAIASTLVVIGLSGCASSSNLSGGPVELVSAEVDPSKMMQDRQAIMAMAGDYKVTFDFTETVPLQADYELKEPKLSGAHEVVRVIRDEPGFISLQHILVVGGEEKFPVKHWRQDWVYEPDYVYDFVGFNSWEKRNLSPSERKGKWAQFVYQVDDSPRYSAAAKWVHENGNSVWASPHSMRPLPRRDMTTRDDYHGMLAMNRHVITPFGWVHEQDNTKLILTGDTPEALVREVGVNTYRKSDDFDVAVAEDYWTLTQEYWAGVRDVWTQKEVSSEAFGLTIQGEPEELYMPVMQMTDTIENEGSSVSEAVSKAAIIIESYTTDDIETSIAKAKQEARNIQGEAY